MYRIDRLGEGLVRVVELSIEGTTLPIVLLGSLALGLAMARKKASAAPLTAPALLFFLQFVLIGAGKPAEYGRFGVFPDAALAIGAACVLAGWRPKRTQALRAVLAVWVTLSAAAFGAPYVWNFHLDTTARGTRTELAEVLRSDTAPQQVFRMGVLGEPAPYCCPPMNFAATDLRLFSSPTEFANDAWADSATLLYPSDENEPGTMAAEHAGRGYRTTPISWANKPFFVADQRRARGAVPAPASDWIK